MSRKTKSQNPTVNQPVQETEGGECVRTGVLPTLTLDQVKAAAAALVNEVASHLAGRPVNAEQLNGAGEVILRGWHDSLFPSAPAPRRGQNAFRPQEAGLLEAGADVVQGRRDRTAVFYNIKQPPTFAETLSQIHAQRVFVRTTRGYAESGDGHVWTGELIVNEVVNHAWNIMAPVYETEPSLLGTYGALYGYKVDRVRKALETKADHRRLATEWEEAKTAEFQKSQRENVRREMATDLIEAVARRVDSAASGTTDRPERPESNDRRGGGRGA